GVRTDWAPRATPALCPLEDLAMTPRSLIVAFVALTALAGNGREAAAYDPPVPTWIWGSQGPAAGQFEAPKGIACDAGGLVYVADTFNNRIEKFTATGTLIGMWGTFGSGPGQFIDPPGIAIDGSGFVYVSDAYNDRIQKFTSSGTYITQWGSRERPDRHLHLPYAIAS